VDKRFATFALLVALFFVTNQVIYTFFFPQPPAENPPAAADGNPAAKQAAGANKPAAEDEPAGEKPQDAAVAAAPDKANTDGKPATEQASDKAATTTPSDDAEPAIAPQWATLGSADPASPYRMLVVLTNQGAAVERLELNSPRYHHLEDRSGYLGPLALEDAPGREGALVHVVGPGTPAAAAGLLPDDVITAVDGQKISSAVQLVDVMQGTKTGQEVTLTIKRQAEEKQLTATTVRRPLDVLRPEFDSAAVEVVRPDNHDPLSFLTTLSQFDDRTIGDDNQELSGVKLRTAPWKTEVVGPDEVRFQAVLPKLGLRLEKVYRLAKVPADDHSNPDFPAYNLVLDVSVTNIGDAARKVAYRLDGPTGLPIEGAWYANKIARGKSAWSLFAAAGLRDVIVHFDGGKTTEVGLPEIIRPDFKRVWTNSPLDFIAVDAQYFASAVIPMKEKQSDVWFAETRPTRVGAIPEETALQKLTNVSFQLDSVTTSLNQGDRMSHRFQIFAGPKRPDLLAQYGPPSATLRDLVYYGWFWFVAQPMLAVLHMFYHVVGNYGIAIIMLTVLVRGCMFPLSRKQALSAQKMQELQPEIKKLHERYKNEPEKKVKAQQDLFRQHQYNPLSGCLPGIVQLPIFVGLYRSLMVDVELRQAPLFGEHVHWASNLAAPDMLWNWSGIMFDTVTQGTGFFGLGPYLNVFPLITVGLFLWQQKMFMPPPADEQAAMQQKMMQYMMVFMAIMFYKVASGLCLYFIASSIWGICERKLLPKKTIATDGSPAGGAVAVLPSNGTNGAANSTKKRQRGRK